MPSLRIGLVRDLFEKSHDLQLSEGAVAMYIMHDDYQPQSTDYRFEQPNLTRLDEAVYRDMVRPRSVRYIHRDPEFIDYANRAMETLKNNSKKLGVDPNFDGVGIGIADLPTYVQDGKVKGKVFGVYDPNSKRVLIDRGVVYKKYRLPGVEYPHADDVIIHELLHHVQDKEGAIHIYDRDKVEGDATAITEEVTGRSQGRIYEPLKRKSREDLRKHGIAKNLRGKVPRRDSTHHVGKHGRGKIAAMSYYTDDEAEYEPYPQAA